jgi:hypothetical protein
MKQQTKQALIVIQKTWIQRVNEYCREFGISPLLAQELQSMVQWAVENRHHLGRSPMNFITYCEYVIYRFYYYVGGQHFIRPSFRIIHNRNKLTAIQKSSRTRLLETYFENAKIKHDLLEELIDNCSFRGRKRAVANYWRQHLKNELLTRRTSGMPQYWKWDTFITDRTRFR